MVLKDVLWLSLAAYAIHILEEFSLDWRDWARDALGLPVEWPDFYITNAVVVVLGIVAAALVPSLPMVTLGFSALMLINAVFFHIFPFVRFGGRFSPGLFTAVILFIPLGLWAFWLAFDAGLTIGEAMGAFAVGAALMATPIIFLKLRQKPYFRQLRTQPN